MARENELREFTHSFFGGRPDLSTLTHSIVRQKFLAHTGRNHLEPEEKQALKRLVEEELLKMQVDEAGTRQEKSDLTKKVKRPSTFCSDQERKRFCFNSESASKSAVSSPDCFGSPAKNRTAEAEISPAEEEHPRQASEKAVENSDGERQRDQPVKQLAKMRSEESSEEEESLGEEQEEGSVRIRKILKEKDSEEGEEEKEYKSGTTKKPMTKNEQAPGKASASKHQTREEIEDSEEEPVQRRAKQSGGSREAKSHEESEKESEEEECLATEKENMEEKDKDGEEEGEDWKPRARSKGAKKSASEGKRCKQESRVGRLSDSGDSGEKEEEAADSGDSSGRGREPPVYRKSKDRTLGQGRKRQNRSSEDEDSCKVQAPAQGTAETARPGSATGEESDSEREVSDSEAVGSPKGERKTHSSKKSSKKGRTRSSSSSSDGSLEPKDRKASSGCHGEDHPAVTRLKRYIRACGAHRNYKKLLGSCRSHKECLSVLRAELEALGMKGNPSLEKCRALKEQREEAAEVASLDVANIISSSGRPRRRTAWNPSGEAAPFGELYRRTLDSEEEQPRQAPPDWSHMRGIISSDGESN
ncbi:HIRA-interacting protein 3 isoform X2 [Heterocephalus glaber]|uniref:HIRA-interacting protein 3 isoform 2 n=1 Tax=Heterocephalus glaber TaxID=10181 RepID=A0A0P6IX17_HETGA|nr:HIRA-interacting protein 3 isoform X2 [Heterocephalus glaber]